MALLTEIADFGLGDEVGRMIEAMMRMIILAFNSVAIETKFTLSIHKIQWIPIIIICVITISR